MNILAMLSGIIEAYQLCKNLMDRLSNKKSVEHHLAEIYTKIEELQQVILPEQQNISLKKALISDDYRRNFTNYEQKRLQTIYEESFSALDHVIKELKREIPEELITNLAELLSNNPVFAQSFTISENAKQIEPRFSVKAYVDKEPAIGKCTSCHRPVKERHVKQHRVIKRKGNFFCIRCICDKQAGDFPNVGKYRLLHRLGRGGMADVYLGIQTSLYRFVAFKWLKNMTDVTPQKIRRFHKECELGASLSHPNIVDFIDAGCEGQIYYIVMELVRGQTLDEILRKHKTLSVKQVMFTAIHITNALEVAFHRNIVHRDLKPANMFITDNNIVKLADFGLARYFDECELSTLEKSGTMMGTLPYMPPEQFENAKYIDHRADIYSLGATLYMLLTGKYPIPTDGVKGAFEYMEKVFHIVPRKPSEIVTGIPQQVDAIVMRCLAKKAEQRYNTPMELRKALYSFESKV